MTDTALLADYAKRRDAEAFAQLVARYQRLIFATCRRVLHEPQDVDDAVQETFLRLATRAGELHSNLGGWLHRCAVTVSIDLNRRREARRRHESAAASPVVVADDPQKQLAELREHLDAALEKLEPEQRELIVQRFFVGRPQTELAAEAGVSTSAMSTRVDRAIEALRDQLGKMKGGMLAAAGAAALGGLLESEHASAAVPAQLTANVMKIGLTGASAGTALAGASSIFSSLMAKLLVGLAAVIFIAGGIWIVRAKTTAPTAPAVTAAPNGPLITGITTGAVPSSPGGAAATPPTWTATQPTTQAVLSGRVVDQKGNPVANATVMLDNYANNAAKTDAKGYYAFTKIGRGGEYRVGVDAAGFMSIRSYADNEPGVQLSPKAQARRDFVLQRGAVVQVRVDDLLGAPVPDANVHLSFNSDDDRGRSRQEKTTNAHGIATFIVAVSKTAYSVSASMKDHEPVHEIVTVDSIEQPRDVTLALLPSTPIKGFAICSDGKPASGWTISAAPQWWISDTIPKQEPIDKDGHFVLTEVGPGPYDLTVWKKDSGTQAIHMRFPPASQPVRLDLPYPSQASLVTLSGRVRVTGGRPDSVMVEAMNETASSDFHLDNMDFSGADSVLARTTTQPAGYGAKFKFEDLPPGKYRLRFESPQIEPKSLEHVQAPGELPVVELKMIGKPQLRGTVADGKSGKAVTQFAVRAKKNQTLGDGGNYVQDDRWIQVSDPNGNFSIELVGPGIYQAQVSAEGYAWTLSSEVRIENSEKLPPTQIKLVPGGTLTGRVVDGAGGGVGGAKVIPLSMTRVYTVEGQPRFYGDAGSVVTDAQGHFTLSHLAAGEESIKIVSEHFAPMMMGGLQITDGKTVDAGSITMLVGGVIEGTVYDDRGRPAAGINLQFNDDMFVNGEDQRSAIRLASLATDSDGHFHVEHLPQLLIYVEADNWWNRHGVGKRFIRPIDGKTAQLDFGGPTPVKGRLLVNGKPVTGARVQLSLHPESQGLVTAMAASDGDGRFTFFGPPAGPYTLEYAPPSGPENFIPIKDVTITDPPTDLGEIAADMGDVKVTVQADDPADFKPLPYGTIEADKPRTLYQREVAALNMDGDKHDQWRATNVPVGKFRATIQSETNGNPSFSIPFERLAGVAESAVMLHVPRASAELKIRFTGGPPGSAKTANNAMLQRADGCVKAYLHSETDAPVVVKLPAGTYRVMSYGTALPRADIPPIELKDGGSTQVDIPQVSEVAARFFELCICSPDGVPMVGASVHVNDAQEKPIEASREGWFGTSFNAPAGRYHATVDWPGAKSFVADFDVLEVNKDDGRVWLAVPTASP